MSTTDTPALSSPPSQNYYEWLDINSAKKSTTNRNIFSVFITFLIIAILNF